MEAVRTSETSVDNHFTRQYIPEDNSEHQTRRRENLKSHIVNLYGEATLRCIRRFESFTHPWWWRQYAPLKRRSTIILHVSISHKTTLNNEGDCPYWNIRGLCQTLHVDDTQVPYSRQWPLFWTSLFILQSCLRSDILVVIWPQELERHLKTN
jgi:hypothetical protein